MGPPPDDPRRCTAKAKSTGKRCGSWAVTGCPTCRVHGSSTKRAKAAGKRRVAEAKLRAWMLEDQRRRREAVIEVTHLTNETFYGMERFTGTADPSDEQEWHEVVPGLWQGGSARSPSGALFSVVLSVGHTQFNEACETGLRELIDQMSDTEDADYNPYDSVRRWARKVMQWVEDGETVLVRCNAGWNRSGVIVARALMEMGWSADDAITHVRETRSPNALCNSRFEAWLRTEDGTPLAV